MRTQLNTKIDIDTPLGFLENVPAEVDVEVETYMAEPYSWGESRGDEREVRARIRQIQLGGLTLNENELGAWIGAEEITRIETFIEENFDDV